METMRGIVVDPHIMLGKPVIEGTRVTVQSVLERLAAGERIEEIAGSHPELSEEKVRNALSYAARVLDMDEVYPRSYSA
jgi:uncharacterized protein (DUF433 family)